MPLLLFTPTHRTFGLKEEICNNIYRIFVIPNSFEGNWVAGSAVMYINTQSGAVFRSRIDVLLIRSNGCFFTRRLLYFFGMQKAFVKGVSLFLLELLSLPFPRSLEF